MTYKPNRSGDHLQNAEHAFENSKAGVKRETFMTFSFRCVALSVTPALERMYPARQSKKTSMTD